MWDEKKMSNKMTHVYIWKKSRFLLCLFCVNVCVNVYDRAAVVLMEREAGFEADFPVLE